MKLIFTKLFVVLLIFSTSLFNKSLGQTLGNGCEFFYNNSSSIRVPDNSLLNPSAVTVEAWVKVKAFISQKSGNNSGFQYIVFKQTPTSTFFEGYNLTLDEVTQKFLCGVTSSTGVQKALFSSSIQLNTLYHLAFTANSDSLKLYVNGVFIASTSTGFPLYLGTKPFYIGRSGEAVFEGFFNGCVDEVRLWNYVRTNTEITNSYNQELTGNEPGLVAYYNMNISGQGVGTVVPNVAATGSVLNGISEGTATSPRFGTCNFTLPLNLVSFTAVNKMRAVEINWKATQEIDLSHFEVERSNNSWDFKNIATVKANNAQDYNYTDHSAIVNINQHVFYYRLKMIDKDGKFSYSKVVSVRLNNTAKAEIFPNPVTSTATLKLQSQHTEGIALKIVSSDGKVLSTKTYTLTVGNNLIALNTERLTTGVYTVVIAGKNTNEYLTFSKQ